MKSIEVNQEKALWMTLLITNNNVVVGPGKALLRKKTAEKLNA